MAYLPVSVERFGGLDVYNDPLESGLSAAVDMLNVDLNTRGRLRSRDGTTALTAAAASAQSALGYFSASEQIVALESSTLTPYTLSNGSAIGTNQVAAASTTANGFARFGDPTNSRLYVAAGALYRWTGAAWSTIAAPTSPTLAAVTANDNRLVISDGDKISFSDAGAPETFGANNFVRVWPGDGETVLALVRWRDLLFAFKQSKFAVFTGTSLLSDGSPVFNYRGVDAGRGVNGAGRACAGEEGVYFADSSGIYVTTGGPARYISRQLEPWLATGAYGTLPTISPSTATLTYHNRRLYVTYQDTGNTTSYTLVYDPAVDAWMVWQLVAAGMVSVPGTSTKPGLYFGASNKKVVKIDSAVTTDQGAAISWLYQTGYSDVGGYFRGAQTKAAERKRLRMTDIFGTGTVTHQVLALNSRPNDVADAGGSVTLGVSPVVARGNRRRSSRGTFFAHKLSGTGAASVSKLTHWIAGVGSDT